MTWKWDQDQTWRQRLTALLFPTVDTAQSPWDIITSLFMRTEANERRRMTNASARVTSWSIDRRKAMPDTDANMLMLMLMITSQRVTIVPLSIDSVQYHVVSYAPSFHIIPLLPLDSIRWPTWRNKAALSWRQYWPYQHSCRLGEEGLWCFVPSRI